MKINRNFILKQVGNEYILIPLGQEAIAIKGLLKTNEVGNDIFKLLQKGKSVEEVIDEIATMYDAPKDVIEVDVKEFVDQLISFGVYQ